MKTRLELPGYEELCIEQAPVQARKAHSRGLNEYSYSYFFSGQDHTPPRSSSVTDMLRPYCPESDEIVTLQGVLRGLSAASGGRPVSWTDMCGGRGVALRQLALQPELAGKFILTNVDLFDFSKTDKRSMRTATLEQEYPGIFSDEAAPRLILADATTVELSQPADIITSVESPQYLHHPLAAICNWYNQLRGNGLLLVSTEHKWDSRIGYMGDGSMTPTEVTPPAHLLQELSAKAITHAATSEYDYADGRRPDLKPGAFRTLAVRKEPGTRMVVNSTPLACGVDGRGDNYKTVHYHLPDGRPPVEIVAA